VIFISHYDPWKVVDYASDCRDPIRADDWKPSWTKECRFPSFMTDESHEDQFDTAKMDEFARGLAL